MKKVLALFLAIIMLFSVLSVSTYAAELDLESIKIQSNQVILSFDLNGGTIKGGVRVYTPAYYDEDDNLVPASFSWSENYLENMYYMVPETTDTQLIGDTVRLPGVNPPSGYVFNGWYCVDLNSTHPGNRGFTIDDDLMGTKVVQFIADYSLETPEDDEMATVFDILVKVFGTIIGLLFLQGDDSVEAGMELMRDLLENLFA